MCFFFASNVNDLTTRVCLDDAAFQFVGNERKIWFGATARITEAINYSAPSAEVAIV